MSDIINNGANPPRTGPGGQKEHLPPGYPTLECLLDSDLYYMVCRRFAVMHSTLLSQMQDELGHRKRRLVALAQEESIGMHPMRSGGLQNRTVMLSMLEKKFAEYSEFILPASNLHPDTSWRSSHPQSLGRWLCRGPNIRKLDLERHQRWQPYTVKVKSVLLDSQDNDWLHYNIEDILDVEGHVVEDSLFHASSSRGATDRNRWSTESELGDTAEGHDTPISSTSWKSRASHACQYLSSKLYLPASVLIYSINISTALAYFMLVNTPNSQQNASSDMYWKGSLIIWFITIVVLLVHGLFFGKYTMECYTRRLILTSIVFCGAIAFSFHALALNVISGAPVGFSSSVAFLQIW